MSLEGFENKRLVIDVFILIFDVYVSGLDFWSVWDIMFVLFCFVYFEIYRDFWYDDYLWL